MFNITVEPINLLPTPYPSGSPRVGPREFVFLENNIMLMNFIVSMFIIPIGVTLNLFAIIALLKYSPKLRGDASTKFVVNLAISDLIFAGITLPLRWIVAAIRDDYPLADPICRFQQLTFYWTFLLSLFSLTLVSINRLILIVFNRYYHRVYTRLNVILMLAFCWTFSLALALIPYFSLWGHYLLDKKKRTWCGIQRIGEESARNFFFILGFALPGITMIITYLLIFLKVLQQGNSFATNKSTKRNMKLFKLIVIIFGAFILCYFPNLLIRGIMNQRGYGYVKAVGIILVWLNCCINPIIYFSFNREYRIALEKFLGFRLRLSKSGQPTPSGEQTSESNISTNPQRIQMAVQPAKQQTQL